MALDEPPVASGRIARIRGLFEEMADLPAGERTIRLAAACTMDDSLHDELQALLRSSEMADRQFRELSEQLIRPTIEALQLNHFSHAAVSHYEILGPLGHGGMGIVYHARDRILGRYVALKFLSREFSNNKKAREHFIHEAQSASALDHPNIATIYEIAETPDHQLFIAMACYPGESLKERIKRGPIGLEATVDYGIQLAGAIATAHHHDILHRDIKPANILLTGTSQLKLVDFGLAGFPGPDGTSRLRPMTGTAAYMSPEQAKGGEMDNRGDIWSIGVVLYEMLTGERLFPGESVEAVAQLLKQAHPVRIRHRAIPPELAGIIRKCLSREPADRYQTADALLEDLKQAKAAIRKSGRHFGSFLIAKVLQSRKAVVLMLLVTLAATAFLSQRFIPATDGPPASTGLPGVKSLAVLPLVNLSSNQENAFFAAGVHEDILTNLAGLSGLRVVSRTSVMEYAGKPGNLSEIARELGVRYIIEGTVRREDDRVRITAQLIDTREDAHLWAGVYDRNLLDVFRIQSEVALEIAKNLKTRLSLAEKKHLASFPTGNIAAYDAFVPARERLLNQRAFEFASNYPLIRDGLSEATRLDPLFLQAWAYQVYNYSWALFRGRKGHVSIGAAEVMDEAGHALDRAIQLAPDDPMTHFARGCFAYYALEDYEKAFPCFRKAIEYQPSNYLAHSLLAYSLEKAGRFEEAIEGLHTAARLNPRAIHPLEFLRFIHGYLGNFTEVLRVCEKTLAIDPDNVAARYFFHYYRFAMEADESELGKLAEMIEDGALKPEEYFVYYVWTLIQLQRWEDLAHLAETFAVDRIPSPYQREQARRYKYFLGMLAAEKQGEPALAREWARRGLEALSAYDPELAESIRYQKTLQIYRIRFHVFLGEREAAEAVYQELLQYGVEGSTPFDHAVSDLIRINGLCPLEPDLATEKFMEYNQRVCAIMRFEELLALPTGLYGIFNSPRFREIARTYDGGKWIPYLEKHGVR